MVLSNALKAKLSLIPKGVASLSMLGLNLRIVGAFTQPLTVAMLSLMRGPFEAPLDGCAMRVVRMGLQMLSLVWRKVGLPLEVW